MIANPPQTTPPLCPAHANEYEHISHLCLKHSCSGRPLICSRCRDRTHKDHPMSTLGLLRAQSNNAKKDTSSLDLLTTLTTEIKRQIDEVKEFRKNINFSLDNLSNTLSNLLQKYEDLVNQNEAKMILRPFNLDFEKNVDDLMVDACDYVREYYTILKTRQNLNSYLIKQI